MKILKLTPLLLLAMACAEPKEPEALILSAPVGPQGPAGTNAEIEVIMPCPDLVGAYPEVLWKVNNKLFAVYAKGQKIHLTEVVPGQYHTTDGRNCEFVVNSDGSITD